MAMEMAMNGLASAMPQYYATDQAIAFRLHGFPADADRYAHYLIISLSHDPMYDPLLKHAIDNVDPNLEKANLGAQANSKAQALPLSVLCARWGATLASLCSRFVAVRISYPTNSQQPSPQLTPHAAPSSTNSPNLNSNPTDRPTDRPTSRASSSFLVLGRGLLLNVILDTNGKKDRGSVAIRC